jgi:hypothetical protein
MTTEAGGGVLGGELRDRIAVVLFDRERDLDDVNGYTDWVRVVNVVMREIAAAGFGLVSAELLADLLRGIIATHGCHNCAEQQVGVLFDYAELGEILARLDS